MIRDKLSKALNKVLARWGCALVRFGKFHYGFVPISDDVILTSFSAHDGIQYAYQDIVCLNVLAPWAIDDAFVKIRSAIKGYTLVDTHRCYELFQMVREVSSLPGDILEVGVWRGGTGMVLATAARKWKPGAKVYLCDTFAGVVKAGTKDSVYTGGEHADTSLTGVESLATTLDLDNVIFLQGIFPEETGERLSTNHIALCHIDVDVYQSGLDVVRWVTPRMVSGACLVFDDYGFSTCSGITRLVNELRDTGEWIYFYNLNKHAVMIKR